MPSHNNISNELFISVNSEITWLHTVWETYIQLYGTNDENMETMNITAPQFFGIIQYVLFSELVTTLNRLTDKHKTFGKSNASLEQIIKNIDQTSYPELIAQLKTKIENIVTKTKPFREWRDKKIAHSDLATALEQNTEILPGITREYTQKLIEDVVEFINEFSVQILGDTQRYEPFLMHRGDGAELMRILKATIKSQNDQE